MVGDVLFAVPCDRRDCLSCGPRIRAEQAAHIVARLDGRQLYRLPELSGGRWARVRERIRGAGADYARCPDGRGTGSILTTLPLGEVVLSGEVEHVISTAIAAIPAGGKHRLSTSKAWSWHPVVKLSTDEATGPPPEPATRWGFAMPLAEVLEVTRKMGFGIIRLPDVACVGRWHLELPPEGTPERRRWAIAVGRFDAADLEARRRTVARPGLAVAS